MDAPFPLQPPIIVFPVRSRLDPDPPYPQAAKTICAEIDLCVRIANF
jgi:hypothetical protein